MKTAMSREIRFATRADRNTIRSTISTVASERAGQEVPLWARLASFGYSLLILLSTGSVLVGFAFESRAAGVVALVAFVATLTVHLVVSVVNYRQVMRRPWPAVEPLADDDDWDAA
jgi:hypothetical protein